MNSNGLSHWSERGIVRMPRELFHGVGALDVLPGVVRSLGSRPVLMVDAFLMDTPLVARVIEQVDRSGVQMSVITDIEPELPLSCIARTASQARDHGPDVIVGIGGGSTLDLAKVISILTSPVVETEGESAINVDLSRFYGENQVPRGVLPVVAVPSTAGTGSEVTPVAVVSDPDRELKVGVSSPYLVPEVAVVDPRLTYSCPASVSAYSGIDALCHAMESMTSRIRSVDFAYPLPVFTGVDAMTRDASIRAIRLITGNLTAAVADGDDEEARNAMSLGSTLAGTAFATGGTHLGHAIQYPVGAMTKTPHGLGVGLLLPYVLEACIPVAHTALGELAGAVDFPAGLGAARTPGMQGDDGSIESAIKAVAQLRKQIGIPNTLADIGVRSSDLGRLIELSLSVKRLVANAPGDDHPAMVEDVVRRAFSGESDIF